MTISFLSITKVGRMKEKYNLYSVGPKSHFHKRCTYALNKFKISDIHAKKITVQIETVYSFRYSH